MVLMSIKCHKCGNLTFSQSAILTIVLYIALYSVNNAIAAMKS